jgi:hypothetical protein
MSTLRAWPRLRVGQGASVLLTLCYLAGGTAGSMTVEFSVVRENCDGSPSSTP